MKDEEIEAWMKKIGEVKKGNVDLSRDEDLSIALMNLISLEEHFFFTAMKTGNKRYLDILNSVRQMRKELLAKIVTDPAGEEWCISKHLLAASMRLMEVGTKELGKGKKKEANKFFKHGFDLWSLFFAINLKMIGVEKLEKGFASGKEARRMEKISSVIKKIVDCCKEW